MQKLNILIPIKLTWLNYRKNVLTPFRVENYFYSTIIFIIKKFRCSTQQSELEYLQRERVTSGSSNTLHLNVNNQDAPFESSNQEINNLKSQNQQLSQDQENLLMLLEDMEKKKKYYKRQLKIVFNNKHDQTCQISTDDEDEDENVSKSNTETGKLEVAINTALQTTYLKNNNEFEEKTSGFYNKLNQNFHEGKTKNNERSNLSLSSSSSNQDNHSDFDLKLNNQYSSSSSDTSSMSSYSNSGAYNNLRVMPSSHYFATSTNQSIVSSKSQLAKTQPSEEASNQNGLLNDFN